jgi:hypothetical protein
MKNTALNSLKLGKSVYPPYNYISRKDLEEFDQCMFERIAISDLALKPEEANIVKVLEPMVEQEKRYDHGKKVS